MSLKLTKRVHFSTCRAAFAVIFVLGLLFFPLGLFVSPDGVNAYAQDSGETSVAEIVLCTGIFNREPVQPTIQVSLSQGKIYTWTKIKASDPPTFIKHVYYHKGKKVAEVILNITYPTFRTWSYKTLKGSWMLGQWRVEVLSAEGTLLASEEFMVTK